MSLTYAHRKKSQGVRSGDLGGQSRRCSNLFERPCIYVITLRDACIQICRFSAGHMVVNHTSFLRFSRLSPPLPPNLCPYSHERCGPVASTTSLNSGGPSFESRLEGRVPRRDVVILLTRSGEIVTQCLTLCRDYFLTHSLKLVFGIYPNIRWHGHIIAAGDRVI